MDNNVSKYLVQEVMSASPAKLVFMLYERAIGSLREAIVAIENGEIEARWRANNRAVEIINHLWTTLNIDEGGEIAENLSRLFPFALGRLTHVDLDNDPQPARDVIVLLEPLRDAWYQLARNGGVAEAPAAASVPAPGGSETVAPTAVPAVRTSISA